MGPKIESLFKLNIGVVFGAHFWGPFLDIIFGSHFFVFYLFSESFWRENFGFEYTSAGLQLPRPRFSSLGLALKVGPEIGPRNMLKI